MVKNAAINAGDTGDAGLTPGWRREWQPAPVCLPGESQGQRSLTVCASQSQARLSNGAHTVPRNTGRLAGFIPTFSSASQLCPTLWDHMNCRMPGLPVNSWSLLKLMSIESVMPSNHLILCHPLLLLPSIFPSIGVFSNESAFPIRWPKYWSFSISISPSNEHPGLISSRMDWSDLLAVQGTLKNLLQHHSLSHCNYLNHATQIVTGMTQAVIPSHPVTALGLIVLTRYSC